MQIESRLQSLVENHATRIFSLGSHPSSSSLIHELIKAMHAATEIDFSGRKIAPNLFILEVNPTLAVELQDNEGLLNELALALQESGLEAGLSFESPLAIRVAASPDVLNGAMQIKAFHSHLNLSDTTAVTSGIEPSEPDEKLPLNAFLIVNGTQLFALNAPLINIGRRSDNHLVINDPRISRIHAQLRVINGQFIIFDLDSTGGTFVNGERIRQKVLQPGDVISLSGLPLVYGEESKDSTETQKLRQGS